MGELVSREMINIIMSHGFVVIHRRNIFTDVKKADIRFNIL